MKEMEKLYFKSDIPALHPRSVAIVGALYPTNCKKQILRQKPGGKSYFHVLYVPNIRLLSLFLKKRKKCIRFCRQCL